MGRPSDTPALPAHVAVIMDGNGRWAKQRNLPRVKGHQQGAQTVQMVKQACIDLNIPYLTLYAFSHENWKRPKNEVDFLMDLLERQLDSEGPGVIRDGIRFKTIGNTAALRPAIQQKIADLTSATASNAKLTLTLALNYGARQEILTAVRRFVGAASAAPSFSAQQLGEMAQALTEDDFSNLLDTAGTPDPDLLIRTSGEMRLSNFLLWQCSYSEIFVSSKFWPEFTREDFENALADYASRERRFGAVA